MTVVLDMAVRTFLVIEERKEDGICSQKVFNDTHESRWGGVPRKRLERTAS